MRICCQLLYWEDVLRPARPLYRCMKRLWINKMKIEQFKLQRLLLFWRKQNHWWSSYCQNCDLITIESIETANRTLQIPLERCTNEVQRNFSFRILVTNFPKTPVIFYKHMCIAIDTGPAKCIAEPERTTMKPTVEVNTVHYKDAKDLQKQVDGHIKL